MRPVLTTVTFLLLASMGGLSIAEEAIRTWTSADGRTLEGAMQHMTADEVTIRRSDGRTFPIAISTLSEADQAYLQQARNDQARAKGFEEGPFADAICGEWVKFSKEEHGLLFQLYGGKELKRAKEPVPLFVHLHGAGSRADDVETGKVEVAAQRLVQDAQYKETPCVVLVPTCPPNVFWGQQVPQLEKVIDLLTDSLPIDRDRIYLSGYSMGARGIGSLLESRPSHYAAAMFADGEAKPEWAETVTAAIWLCFSGERDIAKAEKTAEAFTSAGKLAKFDGHPDHIHNQIHWTLAKTEGIYDWMFERRRGQNQTAP